MVYPGVPSRPLGGEPCEGGVSMWRTVLNLEWRILRKDKAALGIILLFAAFVVAAAIAGGRQADSVKEGLERSKAAEDARFKTHAEELKRLEETQEPMSGVDPRDPIWMGQEGAATIAVLPPAPLGLLPCECACRGYRGHARCGSAGNNPLQN